MLFNIVDNNKRCCSNNIVQSSSSLSSTLKRAVQRVVPRPFTTNSHISAVSLALPRGLFISAEFAFSILLCQSIHWQEIVDNVNRFTFWENTVFSLSTSVSIVFMHVHMYLFHKIIYYCQSLCIVPVLRWSAKYYWINNRLLGIFCASPQNTDYESVKYHLKSDKSLTTWWQQCR